MNNRLREELLKGEPGLKVGETMNGDAVKVQDVRGKRFLGTDKMASAVRRYWNRKPYDGDGSKEDVCAYIGEMKAEDDRIKAEHDAMVEVAEDVADELKKAGDKRTRKQSKRRKNPDESDLVKMDYDRIKKLAASGGVTIEELNRAVGQSGSWLNFREKNKDGMIPRAYAVTLATALGVDPLEIAPEMAPVPEQIEMALDEIEYETADIMNGDEKIAEIQIVKEPDDTEIKGETVAGGYFTINSEGMRMSFATEDRPTTIKKIMGDSSSILIGYCMFIQEDPEDVIRKIVNAHLDSILFGLINKEGGDGHDIP